MIYIYIIYIDEYQPIYIYIYVHAFVHNTHPLYIYIHTYIYIYIYIYIHYRNYTNLLLQVLRREKLKFHGVKL